MNLFKQIINEMLLLEDVSINDINSAIDNHERIILDYHSVEDEDAGPRVVEVYAYGLTKKGNPVLRCYQPYGNTMSKVPEWKFFLVNGIRNWEPTGQTFDKPADRFNPNGDKTMQIVYKIAKFDNTSKDKIFKTDTERQMERLRNQVNNPINVSKLQKSQNSNSQDSTSNTSNANPKDNVFKTDTERSMEKLRQQLNNPTYISNVQSKKNDIEQLEKQLGDISQPISMKDLQQRLSSDNKDNVFKTDTERSMEKLRQQLNNPNKIDLNSIPRR